MEHADRAERLRRRIHFSEGVDAGMAAEYLPQIKEDETQLSQVKQLDRRLT